MFDLACTDPEREGPEGSVRGRMRVAADDRHPGLGHSEFGADHVDDPLMLRADRVQRNPELGAVALEGLDLHPRQLVLDLCRDRRPIGWHVVIGGGERPVGTANPTAVHSQTVERLRTGYLMDEVQVDVHEIPIHPDLVALPDLVE